MANETHNDFRGWDTDFSTRQSVHPFDRFKAFNLTATSTTAADLFTTGRHAVDTRSAVNLFTNPRLNASDESMFTDVGAVTDRSTAVTAARGTHTLRVTPGSSAVDLGFTFPSPTVNYNATKDQVISVSCEHRGHSAAGNAILEIFPATGVMTTTGGDPTVLATSGTSTHLTTYKRMEAAYTVPAGTAAASYRFSVTTSTANDIVHYVDKIMVEIREDGPNVSTYVDGDNGPDHFWASTQDASTSFRKAGMTLIKGLVLKNNSSDAAEIVYVSFDSTASATNGISVAAGATLDTTSFALGFNERISVVSASGTPTITGVIWGTHYE